MSKFIYYLFKTKFVHIYTSVLYYIKNTQPKICELSSFFFGFRLFTNVDVIPLFFLFRSRLGCQVCLSKSLDGLVAKVPESVADARQSQDG